MKKWLTKSMDALIPPSCLLCGAPGSVVCRPCWRALPWLEGCCQLCALPLASGDCCPQCLKQPPPFRASLCLWQYQFPIDRLIRGFKFQQQRAAATLLGRQLGLAFSQSLAQRPLGDWPQALVAVPSHWRRRLLLGQQHSYILARQLARQSGLPLLPALAKIKPSHSQRGLSRRQRQRNLAGSLALRRPVAGAGIVLVDDVMTTTSTARAASQVLLDGGAAWVEVACLARTPELHDQSRQG
ncbi:MAG: ComF family protein [Cellvibrionaceae bacterium]|nr:ComF family protein [Cellvibrionaceae bacterium]